MVNGYGPYRYKVEYVDGEHVWTYLGPVDGDGDAGSEGQDDTSNDEQTDSVSPEDIEDLSPEEIEELKKEWALDEEREWDQLDWITKRGLAHSSHNVDWWDKQGYRIYDTESDAYIDGITGEIHDDDAGVFGRRLDGDEIVYTKDGDEVARMLQWRAYLGRSSKGDEEMLRPIDESEYEPETWEKRFALER